LTGRQEISAACSPSDGKCAVLNLLLGASRRLKERERVPLSKNINQDWLIAHLSQNGIVGFAKFKFQPRLLRPTGGNFVQPFPVTDMCHMKPILSRILIRCHGATFSAARWSVVPLVRRLGFTSRRKRDSREAILLF
jgi:hypothetical protein